MFVLIVQRVHLSTAASKQIVLLRRDQFKQFSGSALQQIGRVKSLVLKLLVLGLVRFTTLRAISHFCATHWASTKSF